jgi:hypothetical protein
VKEFIENLTALQPSIAEVHRAWERVPLEVFGSEQDRARALTTAVKAGLFRDFTQIRASDSSLEVFSIKARLNEPFTTVKNHRAVLRQWISALQVKPVPPNSQRRSLITTGRSARSGAGALRILVCVDRHEGNPTLDLEHQRRLLVLLGSGVEVVTPEESSIASLRRTLLETQCHVLHFIGHGDFEASVGLPVLHFRAEDGRTQAVGSADLMAAFGTAVAPRLVVLEECSVGVERPSSFEPLTQMAGALAQEGIRAAMATAAVNVLAFSHFYRLLAAGSSISDAMTEAIKSMKLENRASEEWATPVLFMRTPKGELRKERWDRSPKTGHSRKFTRWLSFRRPR